MNVKRWLTVALKELIYLFRRHVASDSRPRDVPVILIRADPDALRRDLGGRFFASGWLASYHYQGEVLNMRRPHYSPAHEPFPWRQVHVRAFDVADGWLELQPHLEADPIRHPNRHLAKKDVDTLGGVQTLARELDQAGYYYHVFE